MNKIKLLFCGALVLAAALPLVTHANDDIFPPLPAAQDAIHFDGKGFVINGQRTFVVSAGMEYARVPRELWADRLLRFKRAGFNSTEFYVFWNYHEAQDGKFNFSGDRDLDAYLKLAKSMGLYAIARVGPYCCAEWDSGGYPIWLRNVPNLQVRNDNPQFEQLVGRYWSHLLPIVAANQLNRGGNVILVQLENEHPKGWGTAGLTNQYFQFLQKTALANGLEVPYFFSGLHHGSDPAGNRPWSSAALKSPWFTTEFWCDWFSDYGETANAAHEKEWDTWKIIAYGGNGYNYYMAHGGTDFDYFNNDEDAASYDYGSAVGQTGDLRPEYYKFKRAAWFARSFQDILETSDNATSTYSHAATNSALSVVARTSPAGTILFVRNSGRTAQQTKVSFEGADYPQAGALEVTPNAFVPVVTDYAILPSVKLKIAPTRILGITQQGNTTTLVVYGPAGSPAELYFNVPKDTTLSADASALKLDGTNLSLQTTYPGNGVGNFSFQTGGRRLRILAVNDALVDNTWFVDAGGQNFVVCGPQYVGEATVNNGHLQIATEKNWQNTAENLAVAYGSGDAPIALSAVTAKVEHPGALSLSAWQTRTGASEAAHDVGSAGWLASSMDPLQMGADGDVSSYAWYRSSVTVPAAGTDSISFANAADHIIPFVDGKPIPAANVTGNSFTAELSAGSHTLAVFTSHSGRNKFYPYIGAISNSFDKGLSGLARFCRNPVSGPSPLTKWTVMMTNRAATRVAPPLPTASGWSNYTFDTDAFDGQNGYAWFQTTLPTLPAAGAIFARFTSVDDNAWVYLNGKRLGTNVGWNVPFEVDLTKDWNAGGSNVLTVLVQNTSNKGGLFTAASFVAYESAMAITNWWMRGGPGDPNAEIEWQPLQTGPASGSPQFFKTTFTAAPPTATGANPMWRVTTTGLSRGSVWMNGHNLGRYPEKVPVSGMYIPECWLKAGANANDLVIFDEQGHLPDQVRVQPETAASRDVLFYQSAQTVNNAESAR